MPVFPTTTDAFLSGDVMLVQPDGPGHRSGSDAVLLAATLRGACGLMLDMGAGAGAVGLLAAHANPDLHVHLAECDPMMLASCAASLERNPSLAKRCKVLDADLLAPEAARVAAGLQRSSYDHILSNPPYRKAGHVRTSAAKQAAHVIDPAGLDPWVRTAASVLKPGGSLTLIFAASGLDDVLAAFKGRFGAITILGLHPQAGDAAERVIVRGLKGRKSPMHLLPGFVLHNSDGSYNAQARAILRDGAPLCLDVAS